MFKFFTLFSLMTATSIAQARYEFEYNLLTSHYFEGCELANQFENKVADCGKMISNPILGIKNSLNGTRAFMGANSVNGPMIGMSKTFTTGIVMGLYLQDISSFERKNVIPFTVAKSGDVGLTPIIGYELEYSSHHFKVFTIVTPILLTLGIGIPL